jgi:hypothetical protein
VKGQTFRVVLLTGSVGLIAVFLRRLFRRRQKNVNVGNVSEDWLAQQRGTSDTTHW